MRVYAALSLRRTIPPCARKAIVRTIRSQRHLSKEPWFPAVHSLAADEAQQTIVSLMVDLTAHHEPSSLVTATTETTDDKLTRLWLKYYKSRIAQDVILHMTHDVHITLALLYAITAIEILVDRLL